MSTHRAEDSAAQRPDDRRPTAERGGARRSGGSRSGEQKSDDRMVGDRGADGDRDGHGGDSGLDAGPQPDRDSRLVPDARSAADADQTEASFGEPRAVTTHSVSRRHSASRATVGACLRYRVTGLAAEAAFWVLLSIPPLVLGVVALLGCLHGQLGRAHTAQLERMLDSLATAVLSPGEVHRTVAPTLNAMLATGHADVVSGGFLVALWSGSRALNVAVDTITIASGQSGRRSWVRTRLLAFALYLPALLLGALSLPLLLTGTELTARLAPRGAAPLLQFAAWPVLAIAAVVFLTTLYHLAPPDRGPWRAGLPGALLALGVWAAGSALLREYLNGGAFGSTTGPASGVERIAATAAILLWLYITALAVLIGAVFNAVRAGTSPPTPALVVPDVLTSPEARDAAKSGPKAGVRSGLTGGGRVEGAAGAADRRTAGTDARAEVPVRMPLDSAPENKTETASVPSPRMT